MKAVRKKSVVFVHWDRRDYSFNGYPSRAWWDPHVFWNYYAYLFQQSQSFKIKCRFLWSSICFIPAYSRDFSTSLPLEALCWVKDFQGVFFQFLYVCAHIHPCLGTYLWKLKETDLLTFSFDLCLPVTPLLWWLRLWLTSKITLLVYWHMTLYGKLYLFIYWNSWCSSSGWST